MKTKLSTVLVIISLVLSACGAVSPPTASPTPLPTSTPTIAPTPTPTATPTRIPLPTPQGLITFTSNRSGFPWGVYIMNADGTGEETLFTISIGEGTLHGLGDHYAEWSPDGHQMIFLSRRDGNEEIYIMNLDGTGLKRLTSNNTAESFPAWSPDGQRIAYLSGSEDQFDLYIMDSDGSNQKVLETNILDSPPAWSPRDNRIAFTAEDGRLHVINVDGSGRRQLTEFRAVTPEWSPDGSKIVFAGLAGPENLDIAVMRADGTNIEILIESPGWDFDPTWSPDGEFIAFISDRKGNNDVYSMRADGTDIRQLTTDPAVERAPRWSPAGITTDDLQFEGSDGPWFGEPQCMRDTDGDSQPDTPTTTFQLTEQTAYIVLPFSNMQNGMKWNAAIWLEGGIGLGGGNPNSWDEGENGKHVEATLSFTQVGTISAQFHIDETGQVQVIECEIVE